MGALRSKTVFSFVSLFAPLHSFYFFSLSLREGDKNARKKTTNERTKLRHGRKRPRRGAAAAAAAASLSRPIQVPGRRGGAGGDGGGSGARKRPRAAGSCRSRRSRRSGPGRSASRRCRTAPATGRSDARGREVSSGGRTRGRGAESGRAGSGFRFRSLVFFSFASATTRLKTRQFFSLSFFLSSPSHLFFLLTRLVPLSFSHFVFFFPIKK